MDRGREGEREGSETKRFRKTGPKKGSLALGKKRKQKRMKKKKKLKVPYKNMVSMEETHCRCHYSKAWLGERERRERHEEKPAVKWK